MLISGRIKLTPRLSRFESDHIVFDDGSKEKFDLVVFCTGYKYMSYLLPSNLYPLSETKKFLPYKHTFLPDPKYSSLAFIGHVAVNGGHMSMFEMQTRWFAQVFKGWLS